jgi:transcription-repair coupling factor (superfamily II helicase)
VDRFGEPPPSARNLLYVIHLRTLAGRAGVQAIGTEDGRAVLRLKEGSLVPKEKLESRAPKGVSLGRTLVKVELGEGWRERLRQTLEALAEAEPVLAQG